MSTKLKRILICDDHEIVREALRAQIDSQQDMEVVGEAGDSRAAVAAIDETEPDLAIVDVELPDSDGVVLVSRLLSARPDMAIMIFSAHEQPGLIDLLAEYGARGFVGKSESAAAIVPRRTTCSFTGPARCCPAISPRR